MHSLFVKPTSRSSPGFLPHGSSPSIVLGFAGLYVLCQVEPRPKPHTCPTHPLKGQLSLYKGYALCPSLLISLPINPEPHQNLQPRPVNPLSGRRQTGKLKNLPSPNRLLRLCVNHPPPPLNINIPAHKVNLPPLHNNGPEPAKPQTLRSSPLKALLAPPSAIAPTVLDKPPNSDRRTAKSCLSSRTSSQSLSVLAELGILLEELYEALPQPRPQPHPRNHHTSTALKVMDREGLEPSTSRTPGGRSSRLIYRPL